MLYPMQPSPPQQQPQEEEEPESEESDLGIKMCKFVGLVDHDARVGRRFRVPFTIGAI